MRKMAKQPLTLAVCSGMMPGEHLTSGEFCAPGQADIGD